ncbi:MAG TPA: hypothetical protein VHK90_01875 [Thermoanaerobaculia bacterium]|nr:hypothetical protein [Thermoanaerobaculia bacterium]
MDEIAETLKRHRQDLEDLLDRTSSRSSDAAELVSRIEDLRRRSEETLRRFQTTTASGSESTQSK